MCASPRVLLLVVVGLLLSGGRALGQSGDSGTLVGHVFDSVGTPLAGVRVTASSETQIGGVKTAYTNEEGAFRFPGLQPGVFEVRAAAPKLSPAIYKDVKVGISTATELTIVLEVQTAVEEVKVVQRPPIVSTTSTSVREDFDRDFVENMAHDSRDSVHAQMINSIAGAMNGRVRGGASNQTRFTQDGFDMRGQFPTLKSSAAYEIQSAGYGAEDATASGGLVNLVTKSGSNRMEVELVATAESSRLQFFRDNVDSRTPTYYYVLNPMVSGPIIKDRLWFVFNMESHLIRNSRDQDPEGVLAAPPQHVRDIHKGTFKLTWQVSPRNKLQGIVNVETAHEKNRRAELGVDASAQEGREVWRRFTGVIWESLLTDSLLLRAQAGYTAVPQHVYPANCELDADSCDHIPSIIQKQPRTYYFGNSNNHTRDDLYSFQAQARLEWYAHTGSWGDHQVTLRNQYYTEEDTRRTSRPGDMLIEYNGPTPEQRTVYYANDPRYEPGRSGWFVGTTWTDRNVTSLSDAWQPTRHLTLTPALSYIWARGRNNGGDAVVNSQAFAPSVGAAWDVTRDGRTVLRSSASVYVDVDVEALARHTLGGQAQERCRYNPDTGAFDRNCEISGGRSPNTFGLPCGPTGVDAQGRDCREKLSIPKTWEYSVGGEREVAPGVALALDAVYRRFTNQYETRETNRIWSRSGDELERNGTHRNGRRETVLDLGTPDEAQRRYLGVTFGLSKREGRFRARGSYTWSRLDGTVFNGRNNPFGDIPARDVYLDGVLPDDHRHEIKLNFAWQIASWLSAGVRYTFTSGLPYNRLFRNSETTSYESYRARVGVDPGVNINDPGDDRELRLPDIQSLNAQLRFNLQPIVRQRVDVFVDVLNALALRTTTSYGQETGRDFGIPRDRLRPLRVRLGLEYRY
jgi:hypothetical protein